MKPSPQTVVGIDVGGPRRGFHGVALNDGRFQPRAFVSAGEAAEWCREQNAGVVAVDAPCEWSRFGSSRYAERELKLTGKKIHCFATPTLAMARAHKKGFFDWVFNGQRLYERLKEQDHQLFDGVPRTGPTCFETFPHAIVCALLGTIVPAKPKVSQRRQVLRDLGYDVSVLSNIDLVDAALCAHAALRFQQGRTHIQQFGDNDEGYIVIPKTRTSVL